MTPDPYSILVSERGTRSSYTILVPKRGTRSIYYPGVVTWHSDPHILSWYWNVAPDPHILSWYWNVAPDPYTILVSERDTRSIYYPGTGTWHPIHILSWCRNLTLRSSFYTGVGMWHPIHILSWYRNVAPDPYSILVPERGTRSPNLTTFIHQAFFYTKALSLTK